MNAAIVATGLVTHFGATRAVDGRALDVPVGAVYGVLGPNGVGETTQRDRPWRSAGKHTTPSCG
ncbi:MAG: hypothetical protein WD011_05535 [Nitriliruptoraceae bacterium]